MTDVSDLLGVRFKPRGRSREEGFDCYGLAIEVERRAGIVLHDVYYDSVVGDGTKRTRDFVEKGLCEKIDAPEPNCLVSIRSARGSHCGVYLGDGLVVHATGDCGVVVQKASRLVIDGYYKVACDDGQRIR